MAYDLTGEQKIDSARRHRALLRPAVRQLGHQHAGQPAVVEAGHRSIRPAADARSGRSDDAGRAGLNTIQYNAKLPSSTQWSSGVQMAIPWATTVDAEWVGQHSYNTRAHRRTSTPSTFGSAYPAAEPGSELGQRHVLAARPLVDRSDAVVPCLRRDQPPACLTAGERSIRSSCR